MRKFIIVTMLATLVAVVWLMVNHYKEDATIAVASNFSKTARALTAAFADQHGLHIGISLGSTGKHYTQIYQGAPFDAFFAADSERPELLEQEEKIIPGSRITYARGKLALWSPDPDFIDETASVLATYKFRHLAIANPKLAPYGKAAEAVLQRIYLWKTIKPRLVYGENISQTLQFVISGNAKLGFIAYSQLPEGGAYWLPDQTLYPPIEQQAVLLSNNPAAREFMNFVMSDTGRAIIRSYGYD
jgi:molybdate transport system substrate-binding protein